MGSFDIGTSLLASDIGRAFSMIILFGSITMLLPNTQQILHHDWPTSDVKPPSTEMDAGLLSWRLSTGSAFVTAIIYTVALTSIGAGSNFLYYKF